MRVLCVKLGKQFKHDVLTYSKYPSEPLWERQSWLVAESYAVKNDKLFPQGGHGHDYSPLRKPELPSELQRIATGDLSVPEFAAEFGLLGYGNLTGEWKPMPEPISWIVAHARTVRFCLHFMGMLEESAGEDEIRDELERFPDGPYGWLAQEAEIDLRYDLSEPKDEWDKRSRGHITPSNIARKHITNFISENISGMRRKLVMNPFGTKTESMILFRAMIEAVYWQLADRFEGGGVRRCLACGSFFVARDKRQQYCPPFPGSTRSRCSARVNVQKFRSRQGEDEL